MSVLTSQPDNLPARQNNGEASKTTVLATLGAKYNVAPDQVASLLKSTVIAKKKDGSEASAAEVAAFAIVANAYDLNPFTREIHAFADPRKGIVPIVGIDGWSRIVNRNPAFDGCEFIEEEQENGKPLKTTCVMYIKGRAQPIKVPERFKECFRDTDPWRTMPFRMLRHKSFMQAARYAFSLAGIYDEDEARDIFIEGQVVQPKQLQPSGSKTEQLARRVTSKPVSENQHFEAAPEALAEAAAQEQDAAQMSETANPAEVTTETTADAGVAGEATTSDKTAIPIRKPPALLLPTHLIGVIESAAQDLHLAPEACSAWIADNIPEPKVQAVMKPAERQAKFAKFVEDNGGIIAT